MKQWPPAEVCKAAADLHHLCENSWNGEYVSLDQFTTALGLLNVEVAMMPERPEDLPKGRALLGPKMPEDCAAICALKGERPDEPKV
jgi:hypothetical protein